MVDLHVHSNHSDGVFPVQALLIRASQNGVRVLSLVDHDTVSGIPLAMELAPSHAMELIPGIELNAQDGEEEVHLLGYFLDIQQPQLLERLKVQQELRVGRARKMVEKLQGLGISIEFEAVRNMAKDSASIGRPHIALVLTEQGVVSSVEEAFERYLRSGKPAFVPKVRFPAKVAIETILDAGGIPVLAHPGRLKDDEIIQRLLKWGLQGLEVYYPSHSTAQVNLYVSLARKHGLVATGGSDFHGFPGGTFIDIGEQLVPEYVVEELKKIKEKVER